MRLSFSALFLHGLQLNEEVAIFGLARWYCPRPIAVMMSSNICSEMSACWILIGYYPVSRNNPGLVALSPIDDREGRSQQNAQHEEGSGRSGAESWAEGWGQKRIIETKEKKSRSKDTTRNKLRAFSMCLLRERAKLTSPTTMVVVVVVS